MRLFLNLLYIVFATLILSNQMFAEENNSTWINPIDSSEFVRIPAGEFKVFVRGAQNNDSIATVVFSQPFWMAKTEVTVTQFADFVRETGYVTSAEKEHNRFTWKSPGFEQQKNHPAVFLSYDDAKAYAVWADVDLPTESEWLYACRAGAETAFYWGDSLDDDYLWHRGNTGGSGTRAVATRLPNAWGLFDMVGNVWEYTSVAETLYVVHGSSWTRCPGYKTRLGQIAKNLIEGSVEARLTSPEELGNPPYPWDDDRGFRCLKR